jgi:hypothetical protein
MLYSICLSLSVWIFGIAEIGIARGSPPGTTTEVQRVGFPSAENRFISIVEQRKQYLQKSRKARKFELLVAKNPSANMQARLRKKLGSGEKILR